MVVDFLIIIFSSFDTFKLHAQNHVNRSKMQVDLSLSWISTTAAQNRLLLWKNCDYCI